MIQANELRIGNLFIDLKGSTYMAEPNSVQKVYSIVSNGVNEYRDMGFPPDRCKFEDMEPIPLTEEWLVRFGFVWEETDYSRFQNKDNVRLFFHNGEWNYSELKSIIKYVHQLQNLYRALTGKELELK